MINNLFKNWGADQIIDYKSQKFEDLLHDYDVVYDTIGDDIYKRSFKVLKKGGIIILRRSNNSPQIAQCMVRLHS
jgi:NADPH:quinone reductase-like Zn-dependent oxidoreductase